MRRNALSCFLVVGIFWLLSAEAARAQQGFQTLTCDFGTQIRYAGSPASLPVCLIADICPPRKLCEVATTTVTRGLGFFGAESRLTVLRPNLPEREIDREFCNARLGGCSVTADANRQQIGNVSYTHDYVVLYTCTLPRSQYATGVDVEARCQASLRVVGSL